MNEIIDDSERVPQRSPEWFAWTTSILTVLFNTAFAVLVIVTLGGIVFITKPKQVMHNIAPELWLPLLIIMTPALVYSQFLAWRTILSGEVPTGLAVARRQVAIPSLLKPVVAVVWLWNFGIGCVIVISLSKPNPGVQLTPVDYLLIAAFTALLTFPANIYFILAVKALTSDDLTLKRVWTLRFLVDLALPVVAVLYYQR